jgi:methionine sulfoxide reductase heme-binding subunit
VVLAATALSWYVARAGGLVAFALITASVVVGLALAGRARVPGWPAFAVEDLHRFLGLLAGVFIGLHGLGLLLDTVVPFSLAGLLVPGAAPARVLPTALGVIAAELLAALAVTNHYRRRLPYRFWRRAHALNFLVWGLALVHGITVGTDSGRAWAVALYAVSGGAVAGLLAWRIMRARGPAPWAIRLWPATAGFFTAELVVALSLGPLALHAG